MTRMAGILTQQLAPVRRRQRLRRAMRYAIAGAAAGALAALALEAARRGLGAWRMFTPGFIALAAGPIVGAATGYLRACPWVRAAAAVDRHYQLKDRTLTALAFSQCAAPTALHELAIADAVDHLNGVDAKHVTPLGLPRWWWPAGVLFVCAWAAVLWPTRMPRADANAPAPPIAEIVEQAKQLEKQFDRLKQQNDPQVQQLAEALKDEAKQMQRPGVDVKDALAGLSQMQAMLSKQQAPFNLEAVDAALGSVGDALSLDAATAPAGRLLKGGDFDRAAEALANVGDLPRSAVTMQALRDAAASMAQDKLDQLSEIAARMADAAEKSDQQGFRESCANLGRKVAEHAQRKQLAAWMQQQISRLSESKIACVASANAGADTSQSQRPGENWGHGSSGHPQGESTSLDAQRQLQRITGKVGEGPMETQSLHSSEAKQVAGRDYREAYSEYRKLAESVLESEPIPLGQRQTIRRYFESIRPAENAGRGDMQGTREP